MRIPIGNNLTRLHYITFINANDSSVRQLVTLAVKLVFVAHHQLANARHDNAFTVRVFNQFYVVKRNRARVAHFNTADRGCPGCGTTDVKGTHGQLRAGLADTLCGDNANGFTFIDQVATA